MELSKDEKKVIVIALKQHLEEVKNAETFSNQDIKWFAGEKRYDDFVNNIIKKLK